jgi:hypothetical protein
VNVPPGAPATITSSVRADNLAGPDPMSGNSNATATTSVNTCDVTGPRGATGSPEPVDLMSSVALRRGTSAPFHY